MWEVSHRGLISKRTVRGMRLGKKGGCSRTSPPLRWGMLAVRLFPRLSLSVVKGLGRCLEALADGSEERLLGKETR